MTSSTKHSYIQSKQTNAAKMIRESVHSIASANGETEGDKNLHRTSPGGPGRLELRLCYSCNQKQFVERHDGKIWV